MTQRRLTIGILLAVLFTSLVPVVMADLKEIKEKGVVRHLGVPYANFVTGYGDGLDVEIVRLYAKQLGVSYEFVRSSWDSIITDLSGKRARPKGDYVEIIGDSEVKGDIIGCGLTVLPWREKVISFSDPYFPTAIWVAARADSILRPIKPSGDIKADLAATRQLVKGRQILGIRNTCLDPVLYGLEGVEPVYKKGMRLNDLAPALITRKGELALMDVADILVALSKYPGKIKVLGAITGKQSMAFGIAQDSPQLLASFNSFLDELQRNGTIKRLILKYYPGIERCFPEVVKE